MEEIVAELSGAVLNRNDINQEIALALQAEVLNTLFHRLIEQGTRPHGFSEHQLALALHTQRQFRHTLHAVGRLRRTHQPDGQQVKNTGKQTDSSLDRDG